MLQGRLRNCRQNDGTDVAEELGAMRRTLTISIVVAGLTISSAVPARNNSAGHQKLDLALGRAAIAARADVRTLIRVSPGTGARVADRLAASGISVASSTTPIFIGGAAAATSFNRDERSRCGESLTRRASAGTGDALEPAAKPPARHPGAVAAHLYRQKYRRRGRRLRLSHLGRPRQRDCLIRLHHWQNRESWPEGCVGHGTHVSGSIGSTGDTTRGLYQGIAPGVRFIVLKALDQAGVGYTSNVINAINFAVTNKVAFGIDVMNLSLGHPIYEAAGNDPLVAAVERAVSAGIVVVVSAGNFGGDPVTHEVGYAGITSPGNAPDAITVGAVEHFRPSLGGRSGRVVQLPRPVLVRRLPEARRRGARITSRVERELGISAHQAVSEGRHSYVGHVRLDAPERHQHVGGRGQRRGGDNA